MVRKALVFVACLALAAAPCFGQQWAAKMFKTTDHDFGTVARGSKAEFDFTLSNLYVEDVHIVTAYSSCGCTSVEIVKPTLKTYEEGAIRASIQYADLPRITVRHDYRDHRQADAGRGSPPRSRGDSRRRGLRARQRSTRRRPKGTAVQRTVRVNRSGWGEWQITDVKSSNPHISAKVVDTNRQNGWTTTDLSVTLDKDAPAGYLQDHLLLVTSEGQSLQMPLAVEGRVVSNLTVSPSSLFMGIVQPGQEVTKSLVVKGARPFKVLSITCEDKSFKFARRQRGGEDRPCHSRDLRGRKHRGKGD